jgi:hypothetical protein
MNNIQDFFNKNGFVVIKDFLNLDIAGLAYQYCLLKVKRTDYMIDVYPEDYRKKWDGAFGDGQVPNSYYCYGDTLMDVILANALPKMEEFVGEELVPTYSYWRMYQKHNKLLRHKDRNSCEISTTVCLGFNTSNVDENTYPNYSWPMYVQNYSGVELPVSLQPGDMIVYKGCEIDHWREPYLGLNHAQVFLHYNKKNKENNNAYDGRPFLGIPSIRK